MLTTLEDKIDPRWTALLVIDVQNDYIHPQGAAGKNGLDVSTAIEMVPRLRRLVDAAREAGVYVIYTRNWHSALTDTEPWAERNVRNKKQGRQRAAMAETWGADFYELQPKEGEVVLNKFRYDAFLGTSLEFLLRARGIRTVICTGTATNVCVESTARAAHMRDYHLVLVEDCCAAPDQELHRATVKNVERHFGLVASADQVKECWARVPVIAR